MCLLLILLSLSTKTKVVKLNIATEGYAVYLNATSSKFVDVTGAPYEIVDGIDTTKVIINSKLSGLLPMFGLPLKVLTIRVPMGSVLYLDAQINGGKSEFNLNKLKLTKLNLVSSRSRNIIKFGNQKDFPVSGVISVYLGYIELMDIGLTKSVDLTIALNMSKGNIDFGENGGEVKGRMTIQGTLARVDISTSKTGVVVTKHGLIRVEGFKETNRPATFHFNLFGTFTLYKFSNATYLKQ